MTSYRYRAYDAAGALHHGEIEAESEAAAVSILTADGKLPVEVARADAGSGSHWWQLEVWPSRRLGGAELADLMRDLAGLVAANVALEEALRLVSAQSRTSRGVDAIVLRLHAALLAGASLSEALGREPAFPPHISRLVRAGEISGQLGVVLGEIATLLETQAKRRAELGLALIYPAVLLLAAAGALAVVAGVLVPTLMPLFRDAGASPPLLLAWTAAVVAALAANWPVVLAAAAVLTAATLAAVSTEGARAARDRALLSLPGTRRIVADMETARFARTLATLTGNGIPLLEAVRVVADAVENRAFRAAVAGIEARLETGLPLSQSMDDSGRFDALHVRLVAIAERTGKLDTMLRRIAEQSEARLSRRLARLLAWLAPGLTVVIGGVVGGLVLSVLGTMTSLNDLVLR